MDNYYVEIVSFETEEVVKRMGPHGLRTAERIERGASINLNHEEYFTRVVDEEGNE